MKQQQRTLYQKFPSFLRTSSKFRPPPILALPKKPPQIISPVIWCFWNQGLAVQRAVGAGGRGTACSPTLQTCECAVACVVCLVVARIHRLVMTPRGAPPSYAAPRENTSAEGTSSPPPQPTQQRSGGGGRRARADGGSVGPWGLNGPWTLFSPSQTPLRQGLHRAEAGVRP